MAHLKWIYPLKMVDLSIAMLVYQRVCPKIDGQNMAKPKIQRLAVNVFPLFIPSFILSAGRADQSASYAFSKLYRDQETALTMEFSEMDIWKYAGGED